MEAAPRPQARDGAFRRRPITEDGWDGDGGRGSGPNGDGLNLSRAVGRGSGFDLLYGARPTDDAPDVGQDDEGEAGVLSIRGATVGHEKGG